MILVHLVICQFGVRRQEAQEGPKGMDMAKLLTFDSRHAGIAGMQGQRARGPAKSNAAAAAISLLQMPTATAIAIALPCHCPRPATPAHDFCFPAFLAVLAVPRGASRSAAHRAPTAPIARNAHVPPGV